MIPVDLNYIIMQLFQPYFYYSTTLLAVSFICVRALTKYNRLLTTRMKSLCYLFPLTIPVLLIAFTSPWLIMRLLFEVKALSYNPRNTLLATLLNHHITTLPTPIVFDRVKPLDNLPITNMLLAIGLTLSAFYLLATVTLNDRVAKRVFRIVELEPGEYKSLQKRVEEVSKKLGINPPKIGLVEDLRPNAFTVGYGRRTMLVFTLGILKTLKERELDAVVAHELTHVKNNDFLFKTISVSLVLLSFFNPFAYLSSTMAQREREILADEEGARILKQPWLLAKTLVKIYEASRVFSKESIITRLASGLFLSYPISVGGMWLSTHPRLDQRVENIRRLDKDGEAAHTSPLLSVAISILIIAAGIISTYYLAFIQSSFVKQHFPMMLFKAPLEEKRPFLTCDVDGVGKTHGLSFFRFRNGLPNYFNDPRLIIVLRTREDSPNTISPSNPVLAFALKA